MKNIKLELTPVQAKLLYHYLHAHLELRSDDSCNDLYADEREDIGLTEKEWKSLLPALSELNEANDNEPYEDIDEVSAPEPINYILNCVANQLPDKLKNQIIVPESEE